MIKLGITPMHLFKIEVYKGLPFLSIFFYTTYYFIIFFFFFLYTLTDFLLVFNTITQLFLSLFLLLGGVYTISLLFDINLTKVFFTYSTVLNTFGFLIVFVSML